MADGAPGGQDVKIAVPVEGETEKVFKPHLLGFLSGRLAGNMPKLKFFTYDGRIPKEQKLRRVVENHLNDGYDAVIALTDVYTGDRDFKDAAGAKTKMNEWVDQPSGFYPHVALHDFEAWLLPYWSSILELAKTNKRAPSGKPEKVNHDRPPSRHLKDLFVSGKRKGRFSYNKPRDANRILEGQDLIVAANACPELKAFLNTIMRLSGGDPLD